MANAGMLKAELGEDQDVARVLVFAVDDGLFGIHLDWAEAVYQADAVAVHSVRTRAGGAHPFLAHRAEPAFIVDLRRLFDLQDLLGTSERAAFVVVRSGSYRLALAIDELVGVRGLDLGAQVPVASNLVRDGDLCVGHLVEQEGSILVVLDPNRLMDGRMRDALEPALRSARSFLERYEKVSELWSVICEAPTLADVRNYARLCKRGGRPKTATATRTVLKYLESADAAADSVSEGLTRDLLRLAGEGRSGDVVFQPAEGGAGGKIVLVEGRVVDAECEGEWGIRGFRKLAAATSGTFRFVESDRQNYPERMSGSTVAQLIETLESISEGRRGRRDR